MAEGGIESPGGGKMIVSVCVIAYNEEKYIGSILNDIKQQTYPHEKIEVVLIDGMSSDRTKEIMRNFAAEAKAFRNVAIFDNIKRKQAPGWNVAIKNYTGDAIIRIDAHASIPKDFVEKNVKVLEGGEYVSGGIRPSIIDETTPWKETLLLAEESQFGSGFAKFRRSEKESYVNSLFHGAYKREVFEKVGLFNENLGRTEDNEIHYRIRQAGYKLHYSPEIVSYQHTRNTLKGMLRQKFWNGYWVALTTKVCPRCLGLYHFVPFCFVLSLLVSAVLAILGYPIFIAIVSALYVTFAITMAIKAVSKRKKHWQQLLLPTLFFLLHISYGIGSVVGFLKLPFWNGTKLKARMDDSMNILLMNHYAGSPEMGMEFRPYYMAQEWMKKGHKVTILAGDYSHLRKTNPKVEQDFQIDNIDGIQYMWVKTGEYHGNGLKRVFSILRFLGKTWIYARKLCKQLEPDVVIASSTYPIETYLAQKIRRISGARYIHEIHDMWPATLIELGGMSPKNPFIIGMQMAENSFCRKADKVVSLAVAASEYLQEHGMKEEKFVPIPNGILTEEWENPIPLDEEKTTLLEQWKKDGYFIIGYFGGHALSNALMAFLELAKGNQENKVKFLLVGQGVEKQILVDYANENQLTNVVFWEPVLKRQIPTLTKGLDAIYIGAKKSSLYRFGVSFNKLFDAMMAGRPILFAVECANDYVTEFDCGITVEPDNITEMNEGLHRLIRMSSEELNNLGKNGKKAVTNHFKYEILAERFLDAMK